MSVAGCTEEFEKNIVNQDCIDFGDTNKKAADAAEKKAREEEKKAKDAADKAAKEKNDAA